MSPTVLRAQALAPCASARTRAMRGARLERTIAAPVDARLRPSTTSTSRAPRPSALERRCGSTACALRATFTNRTPARPTVRAASSSSSSSPSSPESDPDADWVTSNSDAVRAAPLVAGGASVVALLLNRVLSGVAPVADAGSSQSRADVLCLAMAGCLILTGLTWIALKPKPPTTVRLEGADVAFVHPDVPEDARAELQWCWDALSASTACGSAAVFYRGKRVMQFGVAPRRLADPAILATDVPELGPICRRCMESGGGNYLANLILFPGRVEFAGYLPANAQAVVVTPVGEEGVVVAASGTQRGFTPADQAWMAVIAEKLDQTLSGESRA